MKALPRFLSAALAVAGVLVVAPAFGGQPAGLSDGSSDGGGRVAYDLPEAGV